MKFGFVLPYGDARTAAEYAEAAEQAGWDGFFVWEPIYGWDAWVMLTAAAMRTSRIRLGTMISPLSRMRPWKIASETITLDHLSGGRVTLTVGLGAIDVGFDTFGEAVDRKERAELLDESLEIMTGLWAGRASYAGKRYRIEGELHYPPPRPVQQPRMPVWVVGAWPFEKSMQRAIKYDGIVPSSRGADGNIGQATPEEVAAIRRWTAERRDISSRARPLRSILSEPLRRCARGRRRAPPGSSRPDGACRRGK
jgi:alkanesulfonate monooxygenase SsuD/methylene tetrahydromethanopterin reductase-like flavin-dependent oxidoreductase (luciferase family)